LGVAVRDRRAIMIEGGMQNSGLALGIIAVQFNADLGMVIIASLWGMWHIVSGGLRVWLAAPSGDARMLDWVDLEGATVVDGSGAEPFTADVGVRDGRIAEVGRITGRRARDAMPAAAPG
jgi:hypothetical protein